LVLAGDVQHAEPAIKQQGPPRFWELLLQNPFGVDSKSLEVEPPGAWDLTHCVTEATAAGGVSMHQQAQTMSDVLGLPFLQCAQKQEWVATDTPHQACQDVVLYRIGTAHWRQECSNWKASPCPEYEHLADCVFV
jgi:hypothetical protein